MRYANFYFWVIVWTVSFFSIIGLSVFLLLETFTPNVFDIETTVNTFNMLCVLLTLTSGLFTYSYKKIDEYLTKKSKYK